MRAVALIAAIGTLAPLGMAVDKINEDDRIELTRGLMAEYAKVKVLLPRSKKALEFNAPDGSYDKKGWTTIARTEGPAARVGDTIQITKVEISDDHIVLQINGGYKGGRHWYDSMQVSGGMGGANTPVPISRNGDSNAPGGTSIVVNYHKTLAGVKAAEIKKLLATVLDFDRHSVTEIYSETLPPETQKAIKEKRALVGMDKEQVRMALGQPSSRERSTEDGMDIEDWVYGKPPGKIVFVTFSNEKVIKVKEDYAGDVGIKK